MRALCLGCFLCLLCFLQVVFCVFAICLECCGNPSAMLLQFVRHAFTIRSEYIHGTFAMCSLSVCYIFAMQKYGFCTSKVWFLACKKGVFTLQKYGFCFLNVVLLQFVWNVITIRSQRNGNPSAAVGADLSCPHKRKHPQNGERICACGDVEMCVRWCKNTYLIMLGYGRDESAPTPGGVFAPHFVGERWCFAECSTRN